MQNDVSKKKRGVTRSILRAVKCKMMSTLMNTDVKRCHINTSKCVSSVSMLRFFGAVLCLCDAVWSRHNTDIRHCLSAVFCVVCTCCACSIYSRWPRSSVKLSFRFNQAS